MTETDRLLENARAYEEIASLNARLADEKQYLELELRQEFAQIARAISPAIDEAYCGLRLKR